MKKLILSLMCCLLFAVPSFLQGRDVFKKYVDLRDVRYRDGHFRVYLSKGGKMQLIKLKMLRVNDGGVYYTPRDICHKKSVHRSHDSHEHQKAIGGKQNVQRKP